MAILILVLAVGNGCDSGPKADTPEGAGPTPASTEGISSPRSEVVTTTGTSDDAAESDSVPPWVANPDLRLVVDAYVAEGLEVHRWVADVASGTLADVEIFAQGLVRPSSGSPYPQPIAGVSSVQHPRTGELVTLPGYPIDIRPHWSIDEMVIANELVPFLRPGAAGTRYGVFDINQKAILWERSFDAFVHGQGDVMVLASHDERRFVGFDIWTGTERWSYSFPENAVGGAAGTVEASSGDRTAVWLGRLPMGQLFFEVTSEGVFALPDLPALSDARDVVPLDPDGWLFYGSGSSVSYVKSHSFVWTAVMPGAPRNVIDLGADRGYGVVGDFFAVLIDPDGSSAEQILPYFELKNPVGDLTGVHAYEYEDGSLVIRRWKWQGFDELPPLTIRDLNLSAPAMVDISRKDSRYVIVGALPSVGFEMRSSPIAVVVDQVEGDVDYRFEWPLPAGPGSVPDGFYSLVDVYWRSSESLSTK